MKINMWSSIIFGSVDVGGRSGADADNGFTHRP